MQNAKSFDFLTLLYVYKQRMYIIRCSFSKLGANIIFKVGIGLIIKDNHGRTQFYTFFGAKIPMQHFWEKFALLYFDLVLQSVI